MKILLTGGGTGGHITPILAVAHELKQLQPDCELVYFGEHGGKFAEMIQGNSDIDHARTISAGKFRRYHGESLLRRILDVQTNFLNFRDLFFVAIGIIQSIWLLKREHPDLVFLKGGFVGVPVGLAAAFWHIPIVTHDSDIIPGLANRIAGRWAKIHATGMPAEYYPYPQSEIRYVGVLVTGDYTTVTPDMQLSYKQELSLPADAQVLFITGGSLGAQAINEAMVVLSPQLLHKYPDLYIVHQVGNGNERAYGPFTHERLQVMEFVRGMHRYSGAADVVITRAGANTISEFGVQEKACIVIPSPFLAGGHQIKNGEFLQKNKLAVVIDQQAIQQNQNVLMAAIMELLDAPLRRAELAKALHATVIPDAARQLAVVLLEVAHN